MSESQLPGIQLIEEAPLASASSRWPGACTSCGTGNLDLVYGDDPDGFVLCRECGARHGYCDIGGEG